MPSVSHLICLLRNHQRFQRIDVWSAVNLVVSSHVVLVVEFVTFFKCLTTMFSLHCLLICQHMGLRLYPLLIVNSSVVIHKVCHQWYRISYSQRISLVWTLELLGRSYLLLNSCHLRQYVSALEAKVVTVVNTWLWSGNTVTVIFIVS